jgi:hypothetical protein
VNVHVLHIGNTAAIAKSLRDGLRADGIRSDIMTFFPDILKHGSDFPHPYPKWVRVNPPLYGALRMSHMLRKAGDYDILHFHAFGGITFYLCGVEGAEREGSLRKGGGGSGAPSSLSPCAAHLNAGGGST